MKREVRIGSAPALCAATAAVVESLEPRALFAGDLPVVTIDAPDPTMSEAGIDKGTFRATRSGGDLSQPLVVEWTVGGRATNGVDYGVVGPYVIIPAGATSFEFRVTPISDTRSEPLEAVTLTLVDTGAYAIDPNGAVANMLLKDGTGATLADIGPFKANVNFQPYDAPVPAGHVVDGGATYKRQPSGRSYGWSRSITDATRDRNSDDAYDQRYDTLIHMANGDVWEMAVPNGTYLVHLVAGDPNNFDSVYRIDVEGDRIVSGSADSEARLFEGTKTVTVTDGTITISSGDDAINNKLMFVNIVQLTDAGGTGLGVPLVTFSDAMADAREPGDDGLWEVHRTGPTSEPLTVSYTLGGTATNGVDYETLSGSITIPAGEESVPFRLIIENDDAVEGVETITASLVDGPGYLTGGDVDAVAILQDTDRLTPSIDWTTTSSPQPTFGRTEGGFLQIGSKLYTIGGYIDGPGMPVTSRVQVLDFNTNKWTELASLPSGAARTHGAVATDGRYIYLVAGQPGPAYGSGTSKSFRYEIATNTWSSFKSLPEIRYGGTMFYVDGQLHYVGGAKADRETPADDHWVINPNAASPQWTRASRMPIKQDHLTHVLIDDKAYIVGGEHGHAATEHPEDATYVQHDRLYVYDPRTDDWTRLADMPVAASHFEAAIQVIEGRIVVFGGKFNPERGTDAVQVYDPLTNRWQVINDRLPDRRNGGATAIWQGRVWYGLGFSDQLGMTTRSYWGELTDF
jgi:N-acetylneuraminic acid mutarotase